jgi:hypothetical protein
MKQQLVDSKLTLSVITLEKQNPISMIKKLFGIVGLALMVTSCTTVEPLTATNNAVGDKEGSVKNTCIFGTTQGLAGPGGSQLTSAGICLNNDEYFISEAATRADITQIGAVDIKTTNYLLWQEFELIVYGE